MQNSVIELHTVLLIRWSLETKPGASAPEINNRNTKTAHVVTNQFTVSNFSCIYDGCAYGAIAVLKKGQKL